MNIASITRSHTRMIGAVCVPESNHSLRLRRADGGSHLKIKKNVVQSYIARVSVDRAKQKPQIAAFGQVNLSSPTMRVNLLMFSWQPCPKVTIADMLDNVASRHGERIKFADFDRMAYERYRPRLVFSCRTKKLNSTRSDPSVRDRTLILNVLPFVCISQNLR